MSVKKVKVNKKLSFAFMIAVMILGLSNSGLHPVTSNGGYTGAPGDSACNQCHGGGGNLDGDISISGLPTTIETGQTYSLEVTISNPNGIAVRSGFQLVALNGTNGNAGSMSNNSSNTQLRTAGGKTYFGHSPAQNFPSGNTLTFNVDWTAPSTVGSVPEIKFYAASVIANGNGNTNGDLVVLTSEIIPITSPSDPISITIVSSSDPLCFGENSGTATAEAMGGTGSYTYMWSNGISGATNSNLFAGVHSVTVTDSGGNTASTSITLDDPALLNATAVAPNISCAENTGTITITATGGTGNYTYDIGGSTQTSNIFSNLTPGTYTFNVTDDNGCLFSDDITLEADQPPLALAAVIDTLTCVTTQTIISGAGSSSGSFITYLWSTQDGHIVTGENEINAIADEAGTYTLNVTNTENGCTSQAEVTVVADTLSPSISTTGGELDCNNSQILICALVQEGVSVSWNINGQIITDTCTFVTEGGNYLATATGSNGCMATSTAIVTLSDDVPVIAIDTPLIIDCITPEVTLQSSVSGGSQFIINWTTTDGNIIMGDSTLNPVVNEGGLYTVNVVNQENGCASSSSVIVLADTELPQLVFENGVLVCRDSTILLEVIAVGDGPFEYSWTTDDGFIVSGADSSAITVSAAGLYQIEVSNLSNNCTSLDTVIVTEDYNDPLAEFTYTLNENTFLGFPATEDTTSTFLWDFGNGITSTEAEPMLELPAGNYEICLTVTNECGTDLTCQEVTIVNSSVDNQENFLNITVYPNPTTDVLNLNVSHKNSGIAKISLYSMDGSLIIQKTYLGNIKDMWNISHIPPGIYTLSFVMEAQTVVRTVSKIE